MNDIKPYDGDKDYLFISYASVDFERIKPLLIKLHQEGYRLWYDAGVHVGEEWPEVIASHLYNASGCICFISENFVNSHNCRKELNFSFMKKVPLVALDIEEVNKPLGMQMQLSTIEYIEGYKLTLNECYEKIIEASFMYDCKKEEKIFLVRISTNEKFELDTNESTFGRSKIRSKYILSNNPTIGRLHASLVIRDGVIYLKDYASLNRTYINDNEIEPQKEYPVNISDIITFANEDFKLEKMVVGKNEQKEVAS